MPNRRPLRFRINRLASRFRAGVIGSSIVMKLWAPRWIALIWFCLAGCTTTPPLADHPIRLGMDRHELVLHCGAPLRVEPAAAGGENWYYRFALPKPGPTCSSGTTTEFGEKTSYASASWSLGGQTEERPVHMSSDGIVIEPLPGGKVVPK